MVPRMQLLLVEDDPTMQTTLQRALTRRGMEVAAVGDGKAALSQWVGRVPDAVVLDLTLPGLDGLQVLQQARSRGLRTPVLILTARGTVGDRVMGLNAGADDYLPKPFDLDELEARLRALLRRSQLPRTTHSAPTGQGLEHDEAGQRILLHGQALALTRREYLLLAQLLAGAGRIHTREALLAAAWGDDSDSQDRTVDTHIKTLRAKLREVDAGREYISTHRGMGYCLDV